MALNNGIQSPQSSSTTTGKRDLSVTREEIKGLKHIVQELQKESLAAAQRTKLMESKNQLLLSEAEQLRQEVLEENLNNSLAKMDVEQLRKHLADSEIKIFSCWPISQLNKEISELEALIKSKTYREDELEQELK
ncbi:hypothetical protein B0H11DRAFT_2250256 [Mycena galericulata]|nr:hypothetical protein B0H11DRAFT_2250256 [Mycena galericulata]